MNNINMREYNEHPISHCDILRVSQRLLLCVVEAIVLCISGQFVVNQLNLEHIRT